MKLSSVIKESIQAQCVLRLGSEVADTPFSVQMLCISSASFLQNNFFVMSRGQTKVQGALVRKKRLHASSLF